MPWHAPHQGGIVQLPNGDWWGFSLDDAGPVGRTLWVGPVTWSSGWPYFGDPAAPALPVSSPKPKVGTFPIKRPSHVRRLFGIEASLAVAVEPQPGRCEVVALREAADLCVWKRRLPRT